MSRRATLRSSRDFRRVYRAGRRARRDGVTVWVLPSEPASPTRVGMAIRAAGLTAVARNKIRRRIRAIVDAYGAPPGFDVVIRTEAEVAGRTFQQLRDDLGGALRSAGVMPL